MAKRAPKTREQLVAELRSNADFQRKLAFVRDQLYPALTDATTSVDDAVQNLSIINSVVMESFLGFMKDKKMKELDLASKLQPNDPFYEKLVHFIGLVDDLSVFEGKELLEGLRNEIGLFQTEYWKTKKLDELPQKWIDQI